MDTMQIAHKLVALCKEGKNREALDTLFAEDVVSVEAGAPPGMDREAPGTRCHRARINARWI